jgi:NADPH2:quinone reductase
MKAILIDQYGSANMMKLREVPAPVITKGTEVLVKIRATSVNPLDYQVRRGDYQSVFNLPVITGHDIAGDIVAVGDEVKNWQPGDKVYYSPRFGGQGSYAAYHVTDESALSRMPANLSYEEAAALPLVGGTVWEMLVTRAQLKKGESVLIPGGAGGVGSLAVQVAKALGAFVYTTAKKNMHEQLRQLGADVVIDHSQESYIDAVLQHTNEKGVDVMVDTVGAYTLSESPRVLGMYGRLVTLVDISLPQNLLMAWEKNATYHFVFTRQHRDELSAITQLVEAGKIKPVIDSVFPLEKVHEAHERMESLNRARPLLGKIVISVCSD